MIKIDIPMKIPTVTAQQMGLNIKTGRFYETTAIKNAKTLFMWKLKAFVPREPLKEPVLLEIVWEFGTKNKRNLGKYKTTMPDLDNHQKILQDCMTKLGFWEDDNKIAVMISSKVWGKEECLHIRAFTLENHWNGRCVVD